MNSGTCNNASPTALPFSTFQINAFAFIRFNEKYSYVHSSFRISGKLLLTVFGRCCKDYEWFMWQRSKKQKVSTQVNNTEFKGERRR